MKTPLKTSRQEIVAYWGSKYDETDLMIDWIDAEMRCWRCADLPHKSLDRCHIVPEPLGGLDSAENLILLCHRCHREMPDSGFVSDVWAWLLAAKKFSEKNLGKRIGGLYGMYWLARAIDEYVLMYGCELKLPENNTLTEKDLKTLKTTIDKFVNTSTFHFTNGGKFTPSTWASIIRNTLIAFEKEQNVAIDY